MQSRALASVNRPALIVDVSGLLKHAVEGQFRRIDVEATAAVPYRFRENSENAQRILCVNRADAVRHVAVSVLDLNPQIGQCEAECVEGFNSNLILILVLTDYYPAPLLQGVGFECPRQRID